MNMFPGKKKLIIASSCVLLGAAFIILYVFIRDRVWYLLDSDMAAEMILARRLNEEHVILSPTFYYGTELRILYQTMVFKILLWFSSAWHFVRVYSGIIMYLILLTAVYVLLRATRVGRYFGICGLVFVLPFSDVYFKYALLGLYYIPCIVISFLGLAFIYQYLFGSRRQYTKPALLIASAILAMLASMIGLRQIVVFYLPLFISSGLLCVREITVDKKTWRTAESAEYFLAASVDMVSALAGFVINVSVLSKYYHFKDWTYLSFTRFAPDRLIDTFFGMIVVLGYKETRISTGSLISNATSFLLMILVIISIWYAFKNRSKVNRIYLFYASYVTCAMAVIVMVYSLSDMYYWDLYSIPIVACFFPLLIIAANEILTDSRVRLFGLGTVLTLICVVSVLNYRELVNQDDTSEYRDIVAYLEDNGYTQGYASFWNGNVLTELSDGLIDVWVWTDGASDINDMYEWLQVTEHATTVPSGRVFALYNDDEIYFCPWKDALTDSDLICKTTGYSVYGYDSYGDMMAVYDSVTPATGQSDSGEGTSN